MLGLINRDKPRRRGAILLLTVFLLVFLLGVIAFAVDIGYILLAKTQLQTAADSAALAAGATMGNDQTTSIATGKQFAGLNTVAGQHAIVASSDIVYGTWDTGSRTFTPTQNGLGNAVKVTARADNTTSGAVPLFFGAVFGQHSVDAQASAVATANPRDICFVVDLSSSMNDDTDPANTASINASYPGVATQMMQKFFNDMNFGTYPGTSAKVGAPLGGTAISSLTNTSSSPLLYKKKATILSTYHYTVPSQYLIYVSGDGSGKTADSSTSRTQKAYSWVIDEQLGGKSGAALAGLGLMRNALPNLDSTNSSYYTYWKAYIDSTPSNLGYLSYVAAFEPDGRDVAPFSGSSLLSPMSVDAPYYVHHTESTDAGNYEFPAGEMPTHAARRSIISAIKVIMDRNQAIATTSQQDWVSIVTYYNQSHVSIAHNLDTDYNGAINAACTLQACGVSSSCTATETGLMQAITLLTTQGRTNSNKVVVLLTDGKPNLYSSSSGTISSYMLANPNSNYSTSGTTMTAENAALMQDSIIQGKNWMFFPILIGLEGDPSFMNQMYSIGKGRTTQTDTSPYLATGDPTNYETELKNLFNQIISTPKVRIVQ